MEQALLGFLFSAATISLLATFVVWLWRRASRYRSFHSIGKGKVFVHEPAVLRRKLLGRGAELSLLSNALAERATAIIVGVGGVGKTSLGLALANEAREHDYRQVWISCTEDTEIESILDRLSLHLKHHYNEGGLREAFEKSQAHDPQQWIDLLLDCLSGNNYVFFFDDLYLVKDTIVVDDLILRLSAHCRVIIMTREIPQQLQATLPPNSVRLVKIAGLPESEAVEFLQELGLRTEPEDQLRQLAKRLQGHPKALEICAGLIKDKARGLSLSELLSQRLLEHDASHMLERMLRTSDRRLSSEERAILVACATFGEPLPADLLQQIYNPRGFPAMIQKLQERSLIDLDQTGLCSLHPLVQEYYEELGTKMTMIRGKVVRFSFFAFWFAFSYRRNLTSLFHLRIADQVMQSQEELHYKESLCSYHLSAAHQFIQAAEVEGKVLEVRKAPIALLDQIWIFFGALAFIWILFFIIAPILVLGGWQWLTWINVNRQILFLFLGIGEIIIWLRLQWRMIEGSRIIVTRHCTAYIVNHAWRLGWQEVRWLRWLVTRPLSVLELHGTPPPGEWLSVATTRHVYYRNTGDLVFRSTWTEATEIVMRFGPVQFPEKRILEIEQALQGVLPSASEQKMPV